MLPFLKPSAFNSLKTKWENKYKNLQANIWEKHADAIHAFLQESRQWSVGTLAGLVMLASSGVQTVAADTPIVKATSLNTQTQLLLDLIGVVPKDVRPLTTDEENKVADILTSHLKFKVTPKLQGIRLNTSYGYIGAEQHLARYPGDTMDSHLESMEDNRLYYNNGMAPGLGAWRYFAKSKETMTPQDDAREKYYIAVQTFLSPGYETNVIRYSEFFRFRKMIVVNPQNGKAIIADIGDSGPSPWTGKQLGGSPELMHYLERVDGAQRGPVLYFFVDDPSDQLPLGPVSL